ncbi:MAG: YihY/virulence factor BrkB family protein [Chloroherpetonaceae bacterium]|nr:YihY/virulence factor BrkB family protein [Chloroherpetonaceae bacterium]
MKKVLRIARIFVKKLDQDDCLGLAAEMAYNLALAIVPAILLFVSLMSLIQSPKTALLISDLVGAVLPKEVYQPIDQTIDRVLAERREGIFTVSLIFSFFSTAAVFTTVMKAMERIYNMKLEYSFVRRQLVAAELVLLVSLALGIVFSLILFGAELEKMLEKAIQAALAGTSGRVDALPNCFSGYDTFCTACLQVLAQNWTKAEPCLARRNADGHTMDCSVPLVWRLPEISILWTRLYGAGKKLGNAGLALHQFADFPHWGRSELALL